MIPSGIFNFTQGAIVAVGIYLTSSLHRSAVFDLVVLVPAQRTWSARSSACLRGGVRSAAAAFAVRQQNALLATVGLSTADRRTDRSAVGVPPAVDRRPPGRAERSTSVASWPDPSRSWYWSWPSSRQARCTGGTSTPVGAMRILAAGEDPVSTALRGVNVDALVVGGLHCGRAPSAPPVPSPSPRSRRWSRAVATTLALGGFVAIALGGVGRFLGCLAGGIVVGVSSTSAARYIGADASILAVLALLLVVLWRRPSGLGGAAMVRDV